MTWKELRLKVADRLCVRPSSVLILGNCRKRVKIVPPDRHRNKCDEITAYAATLLGPKVEVTAGPMEFSNYTITTSAD